MPYRKFTLLAEHNKYWQIVPLPDTLDPLDIQCCNARDRPVVLVCEVIQYGIEWDRHLYFMKCPLCFAQYVTQVEMSFSGEE